jgi:hypothetical protein
MDGRPQNSGRRGKHSIHSCSARYEPLRIAAGVGGGIGKQYTPGTKLQASRRWPWVGRKWLV